jgi:hypothetical protein
MTLLHQGATDVLANVVTDKDQRGKVADAKLPKRPPNLRPSTKRDHVAPAGAIIHESLAVPVFVVTSLESVSEENLADRSSSKVMDFALIDPWSLSLPEFALGKRVDRYAASGRKKPAIELKGTTQAFITSAHEPNREVSHMNRVSRIVSPASRGRSNR